MKHGHFFHFFYFFRFSQIHSSEQQALKRGSHTFFLLWRPCAWAHAFPQGHVLLCAAPKLRSQSTAPRRRAVWPRWRRHRGAATGRRHGDARRGETSFTPLFTFVRVAPRRRSLTSRVRRSTATAPCIWLRRTGMLKRRSSCFPKAQTWTPRVRHVPAAVTLAFCAAHVFLQTKGRNDAASLGCLRRLARACCAPLVKRSGQGSAEQGT